MTTNLNFCIFGEVLQNLEDGIAVESWGPTPHGWKEESKPSTILPSKLFNDRNLSFLEKREENGVSTPHVLSMRPYAHIQEKHDKKGLLVKTLHINLLRT